MVVSLLMLATVCGSLWTDSTADEEEEENDGEERESEENEHSKYLTREDWAVPNNRVGQHCLGQLQVQSTRESS